MNKKQKILTALALAALLLSMYAWDVEINYPYHFRGGEQFPHWNEWVRWDDLDRNEKHNYYFREEHHEEQVYNYNNMPGVFFRARERVYPKNGMRFVRFSGDLWIEIPSNGWVLIPKVAKEQAELIKDAPYLSHGEYETRARLWFLLSSILVTYVALLSLLGKREETAKSRRNG
jgi:hypothetical protein